jgi:hypothetical protein
VGVGTGDDTVAGAAGMSNADNNIWDHLKYVWETAKARGTGRRGLAPCRRGQRRCGACPSAAQGGAARNPGLVHTSPCRTVVARGGGSMNLMYPPGPMRRLDDDNGLLMLDDDDVGGGDHDGLARTYPDTLVYPLGSSDCQLIRPSTIGHVSMVKERGLRMGTCRPPSLHVRG